MWFFRILITEDIFVRLTEVLTGPGAYPFLFVFVFVEQIGLPIPAAPLLIAAGAMASRNHLDLFAVTLVVLLASVLADYIWYRLGFSQDGPASRLLQRHFDGRMQRTAESLCTRYGNWSLVFAKFVPGVSTAVPPLCGALGMGSMTFLLFDALGTLLWSSVFTGIGYHFGMDLDFSIGGGPGTWAWLAFTSVLCGAYFGWNHARASAPYTYHKSDGGFFRPPDFLAIAAPQGIPAVCCPRANCG
jgi:membrane protein DedA with SNARE-associated domain